jgi:hypothetical protein
MLVEMDLFLFGKTQYLWEICLLLRSIASIFMIVNFKDIDEDAYKNLKAEAIRHNIKIGQAATESFRLWVVSKKQNCQRDEKRMREAA